MTPPRLLTLSTLLLLGTFGSQATAQKLVLAKLERLRELDVGTTQTIDFDDYFRLYESDPTVTFTVMLPTLSGTTIEDVTRERDYGREIIIRGEPGFVTETVPYNGGTAQVIKLTPFDIPVRLLPDEVPNAVANFMTYVAAQAYDDTIVHRNPGSGLYQRPDSPPLSIAQAGGYTISPIGDEAGGYGEVGIEHVPALTSVLGEKGRLNTPYTLAGALTGYGIFTSQWYFNLVDHPWLSNNYPVFGVVETEEGQAVLDRLAQIPAYDLEDYWFPYPDSVQFQDLPLMRNSEATADGALDSHAGFWSDAFIRFPKVRLDDEFLGTPASAHPGVDFSWIPLEELEDEDQDGNTTDNDGGYNYDKSAFQITQEGSKLTVHPLRPGMLDIQLSAKKGDDEEKLYLTLLAANQDLLDFFTTATSVVPKPDDLEETWKAYYNTGFGRVFDYGFPTVWIPLYGALWIDAVEEANDVNGFWAYDFTLQRWMWTKNAHSTQLYVAGSDSDSSGWVHTRLEDHDNDPSTPRIRWIYIYPPEYDMDGIGTWVKAEDFPTQTLEYWLNNQPYYSW
ncbi:MAG: peptidylprolyl isomerase [Verrucomicrobiota bacterium JB022]|nr:peptidylprolyl isomerase [Verrucomicrobiota bacterium JB022]